MAPHLSALAADTMRLALWGVCIVVVLLAAANFVYNCVHHKDRGRAGTLLVLALLPLAGTTWMAFRPAPAAQPAAVEPILLEHLNLRCDPPGDYAPYAGAEAAPDVALVLSRTKPEVYFTVRGDKYDPALQVSAEFLFRVHAERIRSQASSSTIGRPEPLTVNGVAGLLYATEAELPRSGLMTYMHWCAARNGYIYQCMVFSRGANRQTVRADTRALLTSLRQIDPNRCAAPPYSSVAPEPDDAPKDK